MIYTKKNVVTFIQEVDLTNSIRRMLFSFLKPFSTNVPLLYTLKTSENRRASDVFRRYRSGTLVKNGLMQSLNPVRYFVWMILYKINGLKDKRKQNKKY